MNPKLVWPDHAAQLEVWSWAPYLQTPWKKNTASIVKTHPT